MKTWQFAAQNTSVPAIIAVMTEMVVVTFITSTAEQMIMLISLAVMQCAATFARSSLKDTWSIFCL